MGAIKTESVKGVEPALKTVNVLGTQYTYRCDNPDNNPFLKDYDGYTDKTTKQIVVAAATPDCELGAYTVYYKKLLRHEIIHAFLFESGLHENWKHDDGHDETYVDWIAVQFPKLLEAFKEAGAL